MKIELVIDELVLHGFDRRQRHAIGDAVARELTRLARTHARELRGHQSIDVARLDAGSFETPARTAASAGGGIAHSVFTAVRGTSQ
jgi:rRNA-processing protein FCF1